MPTILRTPPSGSAPAPKTPPPIKPSQPNGSSESTQTDPDTFFKCHPARRLIFRSALDKHSAQTLKITNTSTEPLLYKVKTNEHRTYVVKFGSGIVEPDCSVEVEVIQRALRVFPRPQDIARHRFLVVTAPISAVSTGGIGKPDNATELWSRVPAASVIKRTLGVIVQQSAFYIPVDQLITFKPSILAFVPSQDPNGSCCSHLDVTNISDFPVLFKMKTTNQMGYVVRPRVGILDPKQTYRIELSSQPKSKRMDANGEITANPIVPVSRPTSHDKFKLEVTAVQSESLLGNVTPQDLWPRVLPGDVSTVVFPVLRNADPRKLSPSELPDRAAHRLQADIDSSLALNGSSRIRRSGSFVDTLEDILFWTPKTLRLRAQNDSGQQASILHLSNISEKTLLYRIKTPNTGLYEFFPQMDLIPAYDSVNISVNVQNLTVMCDNWVSLSDKASIEVAKIHVKLEGSFNKDENDLEDMWSSIPEEDIMKASFPIQIHNRL
ncbi:Vesicle-associated membrane protein-associated protein [Gracilariopsis chorda]|uniref:Vesicle-associated membrane protein-associated protein n=1 Tax=Gracilariopsis chorda TaxID=448386 RepID=A0A2V3IJ65_9FLOR|nr:Vesicle-associated membrane protein-associated protein [Gracilariopsis chorda]|eukprot:PXF42145.1 Vesicle-associated membrane protein-associated protein [Gracilariopsis chorda]